MRVPTATAGPAIAVAVALSLAGAASAAAATAPPRFGLAAPPVRISTRAACPPPDATVQPRAEAEVSLAADPRDPRRLLAGWIQDRSTTGGGAALGLSGSLDGGATWTDQRAPGLTECATSAGTRVSDPWLSIGPDGRAYFAGIPGLVTEPVLSTLIRIGAAPGGGPFAPAATVDARAGFADKGSVTADPTRPGVAYAAWTRNFGTGLFARTDDGGATWSAPRVIASRSARVGVLGVVLAVPRPGVLVAVFIIPGGASHIASARSVDGGATWSAARTIARVNDSSPVAPEGDFIRSGDALPSVATNPLTGRIYVAWADGTERRSRIRMATSGDAARSWGRPRTVAGGRGQVFTPVIAAGPAAVGVLYDDQRRDRAGDRPLTTDVRFAASSDRGRMWSDRLVAGPFDLRRGPVADGAHFLGDYAGLVATGDGFTAAYVAAPPVARSGRSDVFVARLRPRG